MSTKSREIIREGYLVGRVLFLWRSSLAVCGEYFKYYYGTHTHNKNFACLSTLDTSAEMNTAALLVMLLEEQGGKPAVRVRKNMNRRPRVYLRNIVAKE